MRFLILVESFVDCFGFRVGVSMGHGVAFLGAWPDGLGKCLLRLNAATQQAKSKLVLSDFQYLQQEINALHHF